LNEKSSTDRHWNARATGVENDIDVNIMDVFQRDLEYECVCRYLTKDMTVLEVGCGNGFSTQRFRVLTKHIDAFDYAEDMIKRAKASFGETNNRFIHDNVLSPQHLVGSYDTVICIRVLINLQNLEQQCQVIRNLVPFVKPQGLFIVAEGFTEGFDALTQLRSQIDLPPIEPAKINFYSPLDAVLPEIEKHFAVEDTFHLGMYDYLTRVVYPLMVGTENITRNSVFHERCAQLARAYNPDCFAPFSRMRGFICRKRAATQ
jgi:ubiquinone/menaquinone biosynthesis C-methylase UbiE